MKCYKKRKIHIIIVIGLVVILSIITVCSNLAYFHAIIIPSFKEDDHISLKEFHNSNNKKEKVKSDEEFRKRQETYNNKDHPNDKNDDDDTRILPIIPQTSFDSLSTFFSNYTGRGGWIDVGALLLSSDRNQQVVVTELRQMAKQMKEPHHNLQCGHPRIRMNHTNNNTIDSSSLMEYCFWERDVVSSLALNDFAFEKTNWIWVVESFQRLMTLHPNAFPSTTMNSSSSSSSSSSCCNRLAFLDLGVNVGDWISPIRWLLPNKIPIYGIEGSPATAAIAAANLLTSSLHNDDNHPNDQSLPCCSKILPFALTSKTQISTIGKEGVCFSKPEFYKTKKKFNFGGRYMIMMDNHHKEQKCDKVSDIAGVTTLEHAMTSLCPTSSTNNNNNNSMPKVYILKMDIEGSELKAISSIISSNWLSQTPPCYLIMEVYNSYSHMTIIQILLSVIGYDAVWRTRNHEYPHNTPPWMEGLTGTEKEIKTILSSVRDYTELIFGFTNVDLCIHNLIHTQL